MEIYQVGGSVRDALLGLDAPDRDWVVTGASVSEMLAAGFKPVGADFPVFLHPRTHEEYALARTERKSAPGYHGFVFHASPEVTLEQDLSRRDLTINAMARDSAGRLIDPFGGERDLRERVLRHVSPAFAEDPVRILRVARFAARFADFTLAAETEALMRQMVQQGEVDALVPERVWREMARALMSAQPARFISVLRQCGALQKILPEIDALYGVAQHPHYHPEGDAAEHTLRALSAAAALGAALPVRFAVLVHDLGKALTPRADWPNHHGHEARGLLPLRALVQRLRVPKAEAQLAALMVAEHGAADRALGLDAAGVVTLMQRGDAFRRPERFEDFLLACECDYRGRAEGCSPAVAALRRAWVAVQGINARSLLAAEAGTLSGEAIAAALQRARVAALEPLWRDLRGGV